MAAVTRTAYVCPTPQGLPSPVCQRVDHDLAMLRERRQQVEDFVTFLSPNFRTEGWPIANRLAGRDIRTELHMAGRALADGLQQLQDAIARGDTAQPLLDQVQQLIRRHDRLTSEVLGLKNPSPPVLCRDGLFAPRLAYHYTTMHDTTAQPRALLAKLQCEQVAEAGGQRFDTRAEFEAARDKGGLCEVAEVYWPRGADGRVREVPAGSLRRELEGQRWSCLQTYPVHAQAAAPPSPAGPATAPAPAKATPRGWGAQVQAWRERIGTAGILTLVPGLALAHASALRASQRGEDFSVTERMAAWMQSPNAKPSTRESVALMQALQREDPAAFEHMVLNANTYFRDAGIERALAKYRALQQSAEAAATAAPAPAAPQPPRTPPATAAPAARAAIRPGPLRADEVQALRQVIRDTWSHDLKAYLTSLFRDAGRLGEFTATGGQWPEQMVGTPTLSHFGHALNPESWISGGRGTLLGEQAHLIRVVGVERVQALERMVQTELKGQPSRNPDIPGAWVDAALQHAIDRTDTRALAHFRQLTHEGGGDATTTMSNYWGRQKLDFALQNLLDILAEPAGSAARAARTDTLRSVAHIWDVPG